MFDEPAFRTRMAGMNDLAVATCVLALSAVLMVSVAPLGRVQAAEDAPPVLAQVQEDALAEPGEQAEADGEAPDQKPGVDVDLFAGGGGTASEMVHVPVVTIYPGAVPVRPTVKNPVADDPGAAQRGMDLFNQMNCVGCHAPNGAGGMGPSLSNATFLYGNEPENIYFSILQGRPKRMPAWRACYPTT